MKKKILISLQIKTDVDVVLSRRRARQVALLLGFASADQTRISTAVSEIARNALIHASGGRLDFCLLDSEGPCKLVAVLTDKGPGIGNADLILSGKTTHIGLTGAERLVDKLSVKNGESGGTIVELEKSLVRQKPFSDREVDELANSLTRILSTDPIDEIYQQNQELLDALDQLSRKQDELDTVNSELAQKNLALRELNQTTTGLNEALEGKVLERTKELEESIEFAILARDEAIAANKLKSQFVANISHEIRTPMSGILSSLELALLSDDLPEETTSLVDVAYEASKRLMTILTDILDFSKLESGNSQLVLSEFDLVNAVSQVTKDMSPSILQKRLLLKSNIDARLVGTTLLGDEGMLKKVLLNFLHNAVKFTSQGEISVDVKLTDRTNDSVMVKFNIVDTGIGIAEQNKSRLFHPFIQADASNTRRYGGTGLGLSISNGYVKLMNGQTGFASTLGEGSQFWFEIPLRLVQQSS